MGMSIFQDRFVISTDLNEIFDFEILQDSLTGFSFGSNPNVNIVDGNTLDNTISGVCIGNKHNVFGFVMYIKRGQQLPDFLNPAYDPSTQDFDIDYYGATAGSYSQMNLQSYFTLQSCIVTSTMMPETTIGNSAMYRVELLAKTVILNTIT